MEVRIGVVDSTKELVVELAPEGADEATGSIESALAGGAPALWLTDVKERRVGVRADKVAYVEIISDGDHRRVGFGR